MDSTDLLIIAAIGTTTIILMIAIALVWLLARRVAKLEARKWETVIIVQQPDGSLPIPKDSALFDALSKTGPVAPFTFPPVIAPAGYTPFGAGIGHSAL